MRIAAKRLRYTLEIFQPAYDSYSTIGPAIKDATAWAERVQELLGELHDADVLVPQLTRRLAELVRCGYGKDSNGEAVVGTHLVDYEGCLGLITVCRQLQAQRETLYRQFAEEWQRLREDGAFDALLDRLHEAARPAPDPKPGLEEPLPDQPRDPEGRAERVTPVTRSLAHSRRKPPETRSRRRKSLSRRDV